jgi:hypothetical protein
MILAIIWTFVVALLLIWFIGFFFLHLGFFIWVALIVAIAAAIYGGVANRRRAA